MTIDESVRNGRKKGGKGPQNLRILLKTSDVLLWLYKFQNPAMSADASVLPHHRGSLFVPLAWLDADRPGNCETSDVTLHNLFHLKIVENCAKRDELKCDQFILKYPHTGGLTLISVEFGDDFLAQSARYNFQSRGINNASVVKWRALLSSTVTVVKSIKLGRWVSQGSRPWSPWALQKYEDVPIVVWAKPTQALAAVTL